MKRCGTITLAGLKGSDRLTLQIALRRLVLGAAIVTMHAVNPVNAQTSTHPVVQQAPAPLLRDPRQMAAVLGGIMSYTRWPLSPNPIRLCVLGHEGLVEQFRGPIAALGQRAVVAMAVRLDTNFQTDCDVMYVTAIPPDNSRIVLRRVIGNPILTVGEGSEFCSDGGMFCLDAGPSSGVGSPRPRFSANLDAIARSGLRVNPQVLLLAKAPRPTSP